MATATRPKGQPTKAPDAPDAPETTPETDAPKDDAPETTPTPETPDASEAPEEAPDPIDTSASPQMLKDLHSEVRRAEESKGKLTPVSDLKSRVDAVGALVKGLTTEAQWTLIANLGDAYAPTVQALDALSAFSGLLSDHAEVSDRTRGDELSRAWEALKAAHVEGMFTEADMPIGDALVTRWRASVPETKSSTTGTRSAKAPGEAPTFPPLGFRVSYRCASCGKTFSTRTDNLNSARNECIKHSRSAHGALIGNGTQDFDALGRALVLCGMSPTGSLSSDGKGSVDGAEGGGWKVKRESV